jgi:hypothetical protein
MNSYIRTKDHLTIGFEDGETRTVYENNPAMKTIITEINQGNWDRVRELTNPAASVLSSVKKTSLADRVQINNGVVCVDDQPMHNTLTTRMIQMMEEGFDIAPISKFLVNLLDNPSFRAVNELYDFLEHSNLPITEDGCFIAYKRVNQNYKDIYTGKIDNSVGQVVQMSRNLVDEDKNILCSSGLHFCSREYLSIYGLCAGNHTMIVKINPRDVVSIPADYNNSKGRCCRYEVIGELTHRNEERLEGKFVQLNTSNRVDNLAPHEGGVQLAMVNPGNNLAFKLYPSVISASEDTGIDYSNIGKVIRGERRTAGGFGWMWVSTNQSTPNNKQQEFKEDFNDDYDDYDDYYE